jgi:hypothetical protein
MAADPALKPGTAIKRAGITDPSKIRRLREKLRKKAKPSKLPAQSTLVPTPDAQPKCARAEPARTAALRIDAPMEATMASACGSLPGAAPERLDHEADRRQIVGETALSSLLQRALAETEAMVLAQIRLYCQFFIHTPLSMFLNNQSVTLKTTLALMRAHQQGWSELMRSFNLDRRRE